MMWRWVRRTGLTNKFGEVGCWIVVMDVVVVRLLVRDMKDMV